MRERLTEVRLGTEVVQTRRSIRVRREPGLRRLQPQGHRNQERSDKVLLAEPPPQVRVYVLLDTLAHCRLSWVLLLRVGRVVYTSSPVRKTLGPRHVL